MEDLYIGKYQKNINEIYIEILNVTELYLSYKSLKKL
jgi:hypothetical protein